MQALSRPSQDPRIDLKKCTRSFALRVIHVYVKLPKGRVSDVLSTPLLRAGTSVGAQYHEGYRSRSKAEFISKLESCLQELEEPLYWLELIIDSTLIVADRLTPLQQEANELIAIFVTIVKKVKSNAKASRL